MLMQPHDGEGDEAFRDRMRAAGYKEVRLWTLDPDFPGFRETLAADLARIRESDSEKEAIRFGEALMAEQYADEAEAEAY